MVPNWVAMLSSVSPCWTVYSKGPEGVGVIEGVAVSVGKDVGVIVGVLVGGRGVLVFVGARVKVAVGVCVAAANGELLPNSQKINAAAPATSKIAAPIIRAIGVPFRIC